MSLMLGDKLIAGIPQLDTIREAFYPIGTVVMGNNLTTEDIVKGVYGGESWEQITGAIYGVGDQITSLTTVNEQMPKITASSTFTGDPLPAHKHTVYGYANDGTLNMRHANSQWWNAYWQSTETGEETAGTPSGTVTTTISGGTQVQNGHVLANGTSTYYWKRIS